MADFDIAHAKTGKHEGGYVDDPDDSGKETYAGVSRKYFPAWGGWILIDAMKNKSDFPGCLAGAAGLGVKVDSFYKAQFWDPLLGDFNPSQEVAEELFDTGILCGKSRAVKFLKRALNVLNRQGRLFPDLDRDGKMRDDVLAALEKIKGEEKLIRKLMDAQLGVHLIGKTEERAAKEKYIRGWGVRF